jgi:hypothetical protein
MIYRISRRGFSVDVSDKPQCIPADEKIQKISSSFYFVGEFKLKISMKWVSAYKDMFRNNFGLFINY